jgi:hypothetical protein
VGFGAPTCWRVHSSLDQWRYQCYNSFSAASSLLSFCKKAVLASKRDLAGDEKYASKNNQLPLLRQDTTRRSLKWHPKKEKQMPKLRQPKKLERWPEKDAPREHSTLFVQRLWHSFFRVLIVQPFSLFFFKEASD